MQENQNHSTDETVRYQPGIYCRQTNIIQETTELTIPRDRSTEFNRSEREKENLDIYLSSSANFTCVNTSGNTCFDDKFNRDAAVSYQTPSTDGGRFIGPECVQSDIGKREVSTPGLSDNTIGKELHLMGLNPYP